MKQVILLFPVLAIIIALSYPVGAETEGIIAHRILNKYESEPGNLSIDVKVDLIRERIPNKTELDDLSKYLAGKERGYETISILFHLPNTGSGSDVYVSANHKPRLKKAKVVKYILLQHLLSK